MYPITNDLLTRFQNGDKQYVRMTIGSTVIDGSDIMQGSFSINRYVETDESITIGSVVAAELSCVLNNYEGQFNDFEFVGSEAYVEVGVEDGNHIVQYIPFGYFIFDEANWGKNTVSLTALDRMMLFEATINSTGITFPITATNLLSAICTKTGVTLGNTTSLYNGSYVISALPESAQTYRDLLKWICEISGNNGYISYDGKLYLAWFNGATQFSITTANRTQSDIDRGEFLITGVTITQGEDEYSAGVTSRPIKIKDNPLITNQQQTLANSLYQKLGGYQYNPFSATMLPSPMIYPMDCATFVTADGDSVLVSITEVTFKLNGNTSIAGRGGKTVYDRGYGLADAILSASNIKEGTLPSGRIADGGITGAKIAAEAVTEGKLAANAVTEGKIAANAVVADKIASNAVTTDKLAALAVTAAKIDTGAVTADKIYVTDLESLHATIGGWSIDSDALKKTYQGGQGEDGVWLKARANHTGSAIEVKDDMSDLCINYDGSIVSSENAVVYYNETKIDDGEIFTESEYWATPGDYSSEARRGETQIVGSEIEVTNSHRNGQSRENPTFKGELSGYLNNAVVGVEALTTNGRSEFYGLASDQNAEFEADYAGNIIHGKVDSNDAYIAVSKSGTGSVTIDADEKAVYIHNSSQANPKSIIGENQLQVNNHNLLQLTPFLAQVWAKEIPSNANLSTSTYCSVGQYYCSRDADAQTLSNCPTNGLAFVMTVEAPIQSEYGQTSGYERYYVRKITTYTGIQYVQNVTKNTSNVFSFGSWQTIASYVPTTIFSVQNTSFDIQNATAETVIRITTAGGNAVMMDFGNDGTHGIYSRGYGSSMTSSYTAAGTWLLARNSAGSLIAPLWASTGSSGNPIYFNSSGIPTSMSGSDIINGLGEGSDNANRNDFIVAQYANGGSTYNTYYRRPLSKLFAAMNSSDITTALGYTPQSSLGYTPVDKAGDTMSGNLSITNANIFMSASSEKYVKITADSGIALYLDMAGSGHGLWSSGYGSSLTSTSSYTANGTWIIRRAADGTVNISKWANTGNSTTPVYFDSDGKPATCSVVSSVAVTGSKGISVSGSPITSSGTIDVSMSTSTGTASRNTTNTSAGTVKYTKYGRVVTVYTTTQVSISSTGAALNKTYFTGLPKPSEAVTFIGAGASNKSVPLKITTDGYIQAAFDIPPSGSLTIGCTYIAAS